MPYEPLEEKRVYVHSEELADRVWHLVMQWDWFAKKTCGSQFVNSTDSIGANVAEAGGRFHPNDVKNFLYHARGSQRETKYWLRRAVARRLLEPALFQELDSKLECMAKELNESINFQKQRALGKTT
jgi:four helix bundle protein